MIITFTIAQLLTACAGIVTISGAFAVLYKLYSFAKKPETDQNERITKIEKRLARHDELLNRDSEKLKEIDDGNRIIQKTLLALLSHGIDGNEIDGMKKAKNELESFLINK